MTITEIKYYYMKLEEQEQKGGGNHQDQGDGDQVLFPEKVNRDV